MIFPRKALLISQQHRLLVLIVEPLVQNTFTGKNREFLFLLLQRLPRRGRSYMLFLFLFVADRVPYLTNICLPSRLTCNIEYEYVRCTIYRTAYRYSFKAYTAKRFPFTGQLKLQADRCVQSASQGISPVGYRKISPSIFRLANLHEGFGVQI